MKNIEEQLKKTPLIPVPDTLDRRIKDIFRKERIQNAKDVSTPIPLWASVAACVIFMVLGFANMILSSIVITLVIPSNM
jgi:hypothetical protein